MIDVIGDREGLLPPWEPPNGVPWVTQIIRFLVGWMVLSFLILVLLSSIFSTRNHGYSRRLQCASNIRQMGLGITMYANLNHCYPPGTLPNADLPIDRRLGWGFLILPYIDMVDYLPEKGSSEPEAAGLPWDDPVFADLASHPPGITRCPQSLTRRGYLAIAGLGTDAPSLPTNHRRAGIFGDGRRVTPADLKDGASTTMMLADSDATPGPWFAGGRRTVQGLDPSRQPYIGPGRQFGGSHEGGANVLMADGSVKFISSSIDPKILEGMSTIAGGEAVPADIDD